MVLMSRIFSGLSAQPPPSHMGEHTTCHDLTCTSFFLSSSSSSSGVRSLPSVFIDLFPTFPTFSGCHSTWSSDRVRRSSPCFSSSCCCSSDQRSRPTRSWAPSTQDANRFTSMEADDEDDDDYRIKVVFRPMERNLSTQATGKTT